MRTNIPIERESEIYWSYLPPGGVLLMRPLLLHASSVATIPSHRRVIHLEYANAQLPSGLEWYCDVENGALGFCHNTPYV